MKPEFVHQFIRGTSERMLSLLRDPGGDEREPDWRWKILSDHSARMADGFAMTFQLAA